MSKTGKQFDILYYHGIKALIQVLQGNMDEARELLGQAENLFSSKSHISPYYISGYVLSDLLLNIFLLETSLDTNDKFKISAYKKKAYKSGKLALKHCKKYAPDKIEVFRLIGVYHLLNDNQSQALNWWEKCKP